MLCSELGCSILIFTSPSVVCISLTCLLVVVVVMFHGWFRCLWVFFSLFH